MSDILFNEIAIVVITAGVLSLILYLLRQPLIIAYIATGLIVGPALLGLTNSPETFAALSEIGIALLLFLVGLNLNWQNIRDVGKISVLAGLGQILFTTALGALVVSLFGFNVVTSIFLGLAFAFSSTIIIVKLLTDKEDLDRFYGRIAIGVLIVQDLVAMVVLLIVGAVKGGGGLGTIFILAGLKGILAILVLYLFAKYILPHLFEYAARSQELLFLTAISWCFAVASVLQLMGFGIEIGALLAGVSLAGSQFHREIEIKVRPLRDFFLIIFFIVLGTNLSFDSFAAALVPALVLSVFVIFGNLLVVVLIMRAFGYHPRTGFLVGATMAQVSEFSFIMIAAAVAAGLIPPETLPLVTIVGLVTIAVSTYLIQYNEAVYQKLEWAFRFMETSADHEKIARKKGPDVLLLGYEHMARAFLPAIKSMKQEFLVVDFNPQAIVELKEARIPHAYGDAGNEEFLNDVQAQKAKLIVSTIPDMAINTDLISFLKTKRSRASIVVTAKTPDQARDLYARGATFVILPNMLGGELFAEMLKKRQTKKTAWSVVAKKQQKLLAK